MLVHNGALSRTSFALAMRRFFEKLDWTSLRRDDALIVARQPDMPPMAAVAVSKASAVVYIPTSLAGGSVLDLGRLGVKSVAGVEAEGFDPASGRALTITVTGEVSSPRVTVAPAFTAASRGQDWVVVIRKKE